MSCGFIDSKGQFHQRSDCHEAQLTAANNFYNGYRYVDNAEALGLIPMKSVYPKASGDKTVAGRRVAPAGNPTADIPAFQQIPAPPTVNLGSGIFPIILLLGIGFLFLKGFK